MFIFSQKPLPVFASAYFRLHQQIKDEIFKQEKRVTNSEADGRQIESVTNIMTAPALTKNFMIQKGGRLRRSYPIDLNVDLI